MKTINLAIGAVIFLASPVLAIYSGGSGTSDDPWQISCPNDLLYLGSHTEDYNSCFILTADINLLPYTFSTAVIALDTNNSTWDFEGVQFIGKFEGNNYIISNLKIDTNSAGNDFLGLFGQTGSASQISNLDMKNVKVLGGSDSWLAGGLIGRNYGSISYCYEAGNISCRCGMLSGCFGGLAGENRGTINNCSTSGYVGVWGVSGGIVGHNYGTLINCYSTAEVGAYAGAGGLAADNYGTINNCSASGHVYGQEEIGGLVGCGIVA